MISVCVLSYNRPKFLKQTLASMVAGADEPLEIIVHDDGSDDPHLRHYLPALVEAGGISHLILNPRNHNEGQGIAVNRMFHMAKGDLLMKCDQDLMFARGWTTAVREAFAKNEEDAAYGPDAKRSIGALGLFEYHHDPVRADKMLIEQRGAYNIVEDFVGSAVIVPRDAWEYFGPWEERSEAFAEDALFKKKVAESPIWCCALTAEDQVRNVGFGPGPSTVVVRGESGIETAKIKTGPRLVERRV